MVKFANLSFTAVKNEGKTLAENSNRVSLQSSRFVR